MKVTWCLNKLNYQTYCKFSFGHLQCYRAVESGTVCGTQKMVMEKLLHNLGNCLCPKCARLLLATAAAGGWWLVSKRYAHAKSRTSVT